MFDFDMNTWTILADMPVPNMYDNEHWWFSVSSAVVHERKIMVMGGIAVPRDRWSGVRERALDMVIVYDPEADAWTNSPHSLPSPRGFCYMTKLDGEMPHHPRLPGRQAKKWYGQLSATGRRVGDVRNPTHVRAPVLRDESQITAALEHYGPFAYPPRPGPLSEQLQ